MGKVIFYFISILFLIKICDSSVNKYKLFRKLKIEGKLKDEPSEYERWFTQNLDHFSPTDERQWQQRYFVNDEFFNKTRPFVFLLIGGEGEAAASWMTNGSWYQYAEEHKALLFQLEHRFYGKSRPTENTSTENLAYLTSQQALADLAFFISAMNKEHQLSPDVKWIVFGGSYPGSLAAWARKLYPHLIHGAMSASGPLLAKLDFPEYLQVVEDVLRSDSEECVTALKTGMDQINASLHGTNDQNLTEEFNLCSNILGSLNNSLDISNFYENIADNFAFVVQYNHDNREANRVLNISVEKVCGILRNESLGTELTRISAIVALLSDDTCLDYKYETSIAELRNTSWDSAASEGGRQWTYQTCTEFGFFQSTYEPQVFGNVPNLQYFIEICQDTFGPKYNETFIGNAIDRTNVLYGGLDIEVSNVVFVHGDSDPWHVLGITNSSDDAAPAILIQGAAHCANMYNPSDNDSPQLVKARKQVGRIIGSWL